MKLITIGRLDENDICFKNDPTVTRKHAEIFEDDDGNVFLTDLDSANGTFVNGNKIKGSVILKYNDIVKVGTKVLPWRNFLEEEVLDNTTAEKIIQDYEEIIAEEENNTTSTPSKSYTWITASIVIGILIAVLVYNMQEEGPSGIYSGTDDYDLYDYEFNFNNSTHEVEIEVSGHPLTPYPFSCQFTGSWKKINSKNFSIDELIPNNNSSNDQDCNSFINILVGTYEACDIPPCPENDKYYKNGNIQIQQK